ncbi:MAG: hypothetical protein M3R65_08530 [Gemmatimonadota bacterium]|nr:hypothetical protein [Gemmatimonadota bacterium]
MMIRKGLLGCILTGATLALATPLAAHAAATGPGPTRAAAPTDTLAKLERAKGEKAPPAARKKLKPRATPVGGTVRGEFVPDQPWETDFYVDNDVSGRHAIQIAFASFSPRR